MNFIEKVDEYVEEFNSVSVPVVICGDFNIDTLTTNLVSSNYKNAIIGNGFEIQPENPTRVSENSKTCIDQFIYQNPSFEVLGEEGRHRSLPYSNDMGR